MTETPEHPSLDEMDAKLTRIHDAEGALNDLIAHFLKEMERKELEPVVLRIAPKTLAHVRFDGEKPTPAALRVLVKYLIVMEDALTAPGGGSAASVARLAENAVSPEGEAPKGEDT